MLRVNCVSPPTPNFPISTSANKICAKNWKLIQSWISFWVKTSGKKYASTVKRCEIKNHEEDCVCLFVCQSKIEYLTPFSYSKCFADEIFCALRSMHFTQHEWVWILCMSNEHICTCAVANPSFYPVNANYTLCVCEWAVCHFGFSYCVHV